jgi:hypothetical protein
MSPAAELLGRKRRALLSLLRQGPDSWSVQDWLWAGSAMRGPLAFVAVGCCWALGRILRQLRDRQRKLAAALRIVRADWRRRFRR